MYTYNTFTYFRSEKNIYIYKDKIYITCCIYIYILSLLVYLRDLFSRDISRREFSRQKISKIISI